MSPLNGHAHPNEEKTASEPRLPCRSDSARVPACADRCRWRAGADLDVDRVGVPAPAGEVAELGCPPCGETILRAGCETPRSRRRDTVAAEGPAMTQRSPLVRFLGWDAVSYCRTRLAIRNSLPAAADA